MVAFLAAARYVPESRAEQPRRIDPLGQVLVAMVLAGITFAIIESPAYGVGSPLIIGDAGARARGRGGVRRARAQVPGAVDRPAVLRSAPFTGATVVAVAAFASLGGFLFLSALYLQQVRGFGRCTPGC